ncbi:MAG TPA: DUF1963 domain-containing protein [Tepidisphaeraceae bacterium]|jgi:hypothetical protein
MLDASLAHKLWNAAAETGHTPIVDFLLSHARPCIYLVEGPDAEGGVGVSSRMGGDPDLGGDTAWPSGIDPSHQPAGSADFIAQLSFAQAPRVPGLPLPEIGLLSVFVRRLGGNTAVALYETRPLDALSRRAAPQDMIEEPRIIEEPCEIGFRSGIDLPFDRAGFERELFERCGRKESWGDLRAALGGDGTIGQIGGYAIEDGRDLAARAPRRTPGDSDWLLLLRLHLFEVVQLMIYIRPEDLAARDFNRVWSTGVP